MLCDEQMGKSGDPVGEASTTNTLSKPRDPKMQSAKVHMLNGTNKEFELLRGSDGDVLFVMVSSDLSIEEREYFSLCFYDEQGIRHWLYNDKKIMKQLKGLPWVFSYEVKFYPTQPTSLNDDNARYNLFLQLRKDVISGRLPATIPTHAALAAFVAQAEYGDADSSAEYERYLRDSIHVPNLKDQSQLIQLLDKVKDLHLQEKGLTTSEAESKYLDACKQLSMYGVFVFDAKDHDNSNVGIGICATGINIYKETIRVHRFAWQSIVKISYRKNTFSVKLKADEFDNKKEVTLSYRVNDYLHAKRIWKCGVEHHTFFRLIQPEDKPKGGLFRWGSSRFRYQGRTQFQTKMASQMFDQAHSGTVPRSTSARLTQSCDNGLNKENVNYQETSATLGRDGKLVSPIRSPGVSYDISTSKRAGSSSGKVGTSLETDDELVYTPVESPTSAAYYLSERSSLRSPYSSGAVSPNDWSAWGRDVVMYRPSTARRNLFGPLTDNSALRLTTFEEEQQWGTIARSAELERVPIQNAVTVYHRGFYTERPREPTVRIQHYAPRNGYHPVERLQPLRELNHHPIRFFVNIRHSGASERPKTKRIRHPGPEEISNPMVENYVFPQYTTEVSHNLERHYDLEPSSLKEHSDVYYEGSYNEPTQQTRYKLVARVLPQIQQINQNLTSTTEIALHQDQTKPLNYKKQSKKRTFEETASSEERHKKTKITLNKNKQLTNASLTSGSNNLENRPLENYPQLPSAGRQVDVKEITKVKSETDDIHKYRYVARIRHEGEEDIVEKDQIKPELYGLPSTSYDGPLEDVTRSEDLEQMPITEHSQVYHSGQSWLKTSPVKERKETALKEPKKKAVIHVKSSEVEKEEHQPVRLLAKIQPQSADETIRKEDNNRESRSLLFGGLLKSVGKKSSCCYVDGRHFSAESSYRNEGVTVDGQQFTEIRVERRVEVQLEPVFCLSGAGLGAVSEDEGGLIFSATPAPMAPAGRSFLSRLGFKKKSKKSKGEREADSSDSSSSDDENRVKVVPVVEESGQPHTTVASWQETTVLPDNVTIEYDDQGNRITRTVKTSQVKHTVQKQTFQNYTVPDETEQPSTVERTREQLTPLGISSHSGPIVDTQTRSVVYEANNPTTAETENLGEFVSSKTVTSGNRTIETITYKTERDGIIETHVEHRVTIHSDLPIDHDAELSAAIAEATQMNPDMTVEKIEVRQETSN